MKLHEGPLKALIYTQSNFLYLYPPHFYFVYCQISNFWCRITILKHQTWPWVCGQCGAVWLWHITCFVYMCWCIFDDCWLSRNIHGMGPHHICTLWFRFRTSLLWAQNTKIFFFRAFVLLLLFDIVTILWCAGGH